MPRSRHHSTRSLSNSDSTSQTSTTSKHAERSWQPPSLTVLKFSGDDDVVQRYVAARAEERRSILRDDVANRPLPSSRQLEARTYRYQHSLGWFGTAGDGCRALEWLTRDDQALAVLAEDPLSPNRELWPELGFKGGSDDGVAAAAWWMRGVDGQTYVAIVSLVNSSGELDLASVIELMVALRDETVALTVG